MVKNMLKKALEYLIGLASPNTLEVDGETFSDKQMYRISYNPTARSIEMNTLSSLIDYIKSNVDEMSEKMIIHIKSPTRVCLYSNLDYERQREYLVEVNAIVPDFRFNHFIDREAFLINLQSKFICDEQTDRELILKFAGTIESGTIAEYGDDGVTQKATVKTGIASKGDAIIPNPVVLKSFRTFIEVEQPSSQYVFRMNEDKYGINCALFEADGGAWKIEAMKAIKVYLEEQLEDTERFTIIS